MTCRELGNIIKRLLEQGNLNRKTSKLVFQTAEQFQKRIPAGNIKWTGSYVNIQTSVKPLLLWQFSNNVMNLAYKYGFILDNTEITVNGHTIIDIEGDSLLNQAVLVI